MVRLVTTSDFIDPARCRCGNAPTYQGECVRCWRHEQERRIPDLLAASIRLVREAKS